MEILCSLDNIQFPITKYEIKNKEIKLEISFDINKYKGVFEQLEIKCIPLLFDKYKDTILQLIFIKLNAKIVNFLDRIFTRI